MKIVFMGTPEFARVCLQALVEGPPESSSKGEFNVLAVVTQPDRPAGRGKKPQISPVKAFALEKGIEVLQPERANRGDFPEILAGLGADIFVVAAFGQILSQKVLDIPKFGAINVHASLLPKYRGAAPIQQAILEGETLTGITIMQMDAGMDTGDMLLKREIPIKPDDTGGSLHDKLCQIAPEALLTALRQIAKGSAAPQAQNHDEATYAPIITKEMARIDFNKPTRQIIDFIRAYNPHPGAYAEIGGKILKIWNTAQHSDEIAANPGDVIKTCPKEGIFIATKDGQLQILELTPPGGKKMPAPDYVKGLK
jgi:methionyl-tRNA formyltransferase